MKYTFVGPHPEALASGRPLLFGDEVEATADDQRLIDLGWLAPVPAPAPVALASASEPTPEQPPITEAK